MLDRYHMAASNGVPEIVRSIVVVALLRGPDRRYNQEDICTLWPSKLGPFLRKYGGAKLFVYLEKRSSPSSEWLAD